MDAHLFRRFSESLAQLLQKARLEKIQEPYPGVFSFTLDFFNQSSRFGKKAQLLFRPGKSNPFLFLSSARISAGKAPSAPVMRLRKYAAGHSIRHVLVRWIERELWLLMGTAEKNIWLVLSLRDGPYLRFLSSEESPEESEVLWPEQINLEEWRAWPVLTPALRRSLVALDDLDQRALLCDLEAGGGDLFLYFDEKGAVRQISCWPLPGKEGEKVYEDVLEAVELAGRELVLVNEDKKQSSVALSALAKKRKRLEGLLARQVEDEARLLAMCDQRKDALLLQANLWRWSGEQKTERLSFEDFSGEVRSFSLNGRLTIRENMQWMFHQAQRGNRGLEHVAARRKELEAEIAELRDREEKVALGIGGQQEETKAQKSKSLPPELPPRVQAFMSSDGFVLLRGRDAKGNQDVRRISSPHDIWVHAAGGPGSHVIIRRSHGAVEIPEQTLDEAGALAACRSWLREEPTARLSYCEVRHVKPMRGAAPGTMRMDKVLYTRVVTVDAGLETKLSLHTQSLSVSKSSENKQNQINKRPEAKTTKAH